MLPQLHEWSDSLLMLFIVTVGNIPFFVFKTAVPAGVGVLLAHFNLAFSNRMGHEKFLCHQSAARQGVGVHVAVIILVAELLLLVAVTLITIGIVGIEVDGEFSYLARVVEIHLVFGRTFGSVDTAVLQVVIHGTVGKQVIVIVAPSLHVVVSILIESAKRIVIVQLVVEAEAAFKEWIVNLVFLLVGNHPKCIGKDGLLELALLPPLVVSSKEICKQFQLSYAVG